MDSLPTIKTERTTLQVLTPADSARMLTFLLENKTHLAPWEPARTPDYYHEATVSERLLQAYEASLDGSAMHFVALEPGSGRVLATCTFSNIVRGVFQACHLGYAVARSAEGTGLMREVLDAGIAYMFDQGGLHRIMANHSPANLRSAALLERLGFEREGFARSYLQINGKWQDMVLNSLLNPAH